MRTLKAQHLFTLQFKTKPLKPIEPNKQQQQQQKTYEPKF